MAAGNGGDVTCGSNILGVGVPDELPQGTTERPQFAECHAYYRRWTEMFRIFRLEVARRTLTIAIDASDRHSDLGLMFGRYIVVE